MRLPAKQNTSVQFRPGTPNTMGCVLGYKTPLQGDSDGFDSHAVHQFGEVKPAVLASGL